MREPARFFNQHVAHAGIVATLLLALLLPPPALAESADIKPLPENYDPSPRRKHSLYLDVYRTLFHEEFSHFLRESEVLRQLKRGSLVAKDVNAYDEVPDSLFFTNRHGRESMSFEALKRGPAPAIEGGPTPGSWSVFKGKNTGLSKGLFIQDSRGDRYLLKFDPIDNNELSSAAEAISSRVFYAAGYYVPEYHVAHFRRDQLTVMPGAKYYAKSGFKKPLTSEALDTILSDLPELRDGTYRASASKILEGDVLGRDEFKLRRGSDPNDPVWHRDRRTFRALRVIASWVNYYDLVSQNTMEVVEEVNGTQAIKHYIIDFGSSLGSAGRGVKPPMYGFENGLDYGEILKSFFTLGFYRKPWQKRADETNPAEQYSSIGDFDNRYFDPGRWKPQLPVYAFKELTSADAFWAAKIVMQFRDEHIRALVEMGKLTDPNAAEALNRTLSERRDIIGRYWFGKVSPLDSFDVSSQSGGLSVTFTDLAVQYGFVPAGQVKYLYRVYNGVLPLKKQPKIVEGEFQSSPALIGGDVPATSGPLIIEIQAHHGGSDWLPPVYLQVDGGKLSGIRHG